MADGVDVVLLKQAAIRIVLRVRMVVIKVRSHLLLLILQRSSLLSSLLQRHFLKL